MEKILLHVGFHKSGSTLVQNYFEQHPDVFFSREILGDFIQDHRHEIPLIENHVTQKYIFLSNMRLTVNSWGLSELERLKPDGFSKINIREKQQQIALRLKTRFPDAQILITLREKEHLIASLYSQYLLNGGTRSLQHFQKYGAQLNVLFDYDYVIKIYSELFGTENIHVFSYHLLKEDPEKYVQSICSEFNIPYVSQEFKIVNPSLSKQNFGWRRFINKLVILSISIFPESKQKKYFSRYIQRLVSKQSNA